MRRCYAKAGLVFRGIGFLDGRPTGACNAWVHLRWPMYVAVVAPILVVIQTARLAWLRGAPRRRLRALSARGAAGEVDAVRILDDAGFAIDGAQVSTSLELRVDGILVEAVVRADYLVSRRGRRYVAEVKTGRVAPRLDSAVTRRQLFEYRHAFDVDGVLLVDADAGQVREVEFPMLPPPRRSPAALWLLVGSLIGASLMWWWQQ